MRQGEAVVAHDPATGAVRLLCRWAGPTDPDVLALRAVVGGQIGPVDAADELWHLTRLFPDAAGANEPDLAAWWVLSGAIPAVSAYDQTRVAYDLAAQLSACPEFTDVDPDLPSTAFGIESAPTPELEALGDTAGTHLPASDERTWSVHAVRAPEAWALPLPAGGRAKGEGVLVGHIDTGYTDHPDLEAEALRKDLDWDVIDGDDDARDPLVRRWFMPLDSPGHGTHTGSVIASREAGKIIGTAPRAELVPIRAVRSVVQVLDGDVARAVDEARRRGCHVISMSLGGRGFRGLRDAISRAVDDGLIVMAAAGNKVHVVVAPAVYEECIAVAATNADSEPWAGSSRGHMVDISAPGESVWVASVDSSDSPPKYLTRRHHGTSFAVATLAGVAALWLAHHGRETIIDKYGRRNVQRAFRGLLLNHGRSIPAGWNENGWDERFGVGIVDAVALLEAELPPLPPEPESAGIEVDDPVARLQCVLGDTSREDVRTIVGGLLGIDAQDVDRLSPTTIGELVYRIGEDDELRTQLLTPQLESMRDTENLAQQLFARTASRAIRTDAGGRTS